MVNSDLLLTFFPPLFHHWACWSLLLMSCRSSPIPFISISPAPEEDPIVEPFSPFSALPIPQSNQNGFRPSHLTPPTSITSFKRSLSSLHPAPAVGQGLEIQKFQVLLAASKQRNVSGKSNQSVEFRKEIAKKAHKNGHCTSFVQLIYLFQTCWSIPSFSRTSGSLPFQTSSSSLSYSHGDPRNTARIPYNHLPLFSFSGASIPSHSDWITERQSYQRCLPYLGGACRWTAQVQSIVWPFFQ